MDDKSAMAQDLRLAIGRIARRMRQLYAARSYGSAATFTELAVLSRLERDGPMTSGALAANERVTAQAIAPVLTALAERGLVSRAPDLRDRRRVIASLTETGAKLLEDREQAIMSQLVQSLQQTFDDQERRQICAVVPLLERLADEL